jgi:hypothetical protein
MTDPNPLGALAPTPRDRAAAWRLVLAMLNRDADSVLRIAHEAQTAADVDRFVPRSATTSSGSCNGRAKTRSNTRRTPSRLNLTRRPAWTSSKSCYPSNG